MRKFHIIGAHLFLTLATLNLTFSFFFSLIVLTLIVHGKYVFNGFDIILILATLAFGLYFGWKLFGSEKEEEVKP